MIHWTMTVKGQDNVTNALRTAAATGQRRMANVTYQWAQGQVIPRLTYHTPYPPERPGQKYKRTMKLQRSWRATPVPDGARIENISGYASYVVGDHDGGGQAWMHLGRWWKAEGIIRNERDYKLKPMLITELNHMFATGAIRR